MDDNKQKLPYLEDLPTPIPTYSSQTEPMANASLKPPAASSPSQSPTPSSSSSSPAPIGHAASSSASSSSSSSSSSPSSSTSSTSSGTPKLDPTPPPPPPYEPQRPPLPFLQALANRESLKHEIASKNKETNPFISSAVQEIEKDCKRDSSFFGSPPLPPVEKILEDAPDLMAQFGHAQEDDAQGIPPPPPFSSTVKKTKCTVQYLPTHAKPPCTLSHVHTEMKASSPVRAQSLAAASAELTAESDQGRRQSADEFFSAIPLEATILTTEELKLSAQALASAQEMEERGGTPATPPPTMRYRVGSTKEYLGSAYDDLEKEETSSFKDLERSPVLLNKKLTASRVGSWKIDKQMSQMPRVYTMDTWEGAYDKNSFVFWCASPFSKQTKKTAYFQTPVWRPPKKNAKNLCHISPFVIYGYFGCGS